MAPPEPRRREVRNLVVEGRDVFGEWLEGLADARGRAAIYKRLERVQQGNFGDHRHVGNGVFELRIHYGPGYRVYFGEEGPTIVLLLCGGDKHRQANDIQTALRLWHAYRRNG